MPYGIKLHVQGDYACFTRPEMKVERVSYDVITPSAARGILEAIHWKPAIRWIIDRIHVLKPIRFATIRRNELSSRIPKGNVTKAMQQNSTRDLHVLIEDHRQQRAATVLRNVAYLIEAHFVLTDEAEEDDTEAKHLSMFKRRADKGQCFQQPYLGTREFAAEFSLVEDTMPTSELPADQRNRDLGWILHDIDYKNEMTARFFRAKLEQGVIKVPRETSPETKA